MPFLLPLEGEDRGGGVDLQRSGQTAGPGFGANVTSALLLVGSFVGGSCRRRRPRSIEVKLVLSLGVVTKFRRPKANDRAATVDVSKAANMPAEGVARKEPWTFNLVVAAVPTT